MSSEARVKRPRVALGTEAIQPYERYQQPVLYKQLYPNVLGADRTFAVPIIFNITSSEQTASFGFMNMNTSKWPSAYDNKSHKAMYSLVSFSIGSKTIQSIDDSTTLTGIQGQVFGGGTQEEPYGLAVRISGPQTAQTQEQELPYTGNVTESSHILATFPPLAQTVEQIGTTETVVAVASGSMNDSGVVTIATDSPHNFKVGSYIVAQNLKVTGNAAASKLYNGGFVVTSATNTSFTYKNAGGTATTLDLDTGTITGLPMYRSFMYRPLYHTFGISDAAFFATYPPEGITQFALPKLDDLDSFMRVRGNTTISLRFMITLLD
mgnify:CR=1 FL=1